jgi:cysteinyl-tRNA synthetase
MELSLYNTLTRTKQPFRPLDPMNVRMYVCGPTVYDFAHIGNARPVIVFDVLYRLLRHIYGEGHVKYVRNITDVEDKISARAARDYPGVPINDAIRKVTDETERQYHEDVAALGNLPPDVEPRATEHLDEMRAIIDRLVQGGFAYVEQDHVLFAPDAMNAANHGLPRYGALSNRSLDDMIAGARVDVAPYKRGSTDFVLWKPSTESDPGWPSPAGITTKGRPGWHIECSAMAWKHLGEQFDIHGGGIDLVFPHHENEVAQSCCAFHTERMASVWMHNGFLQVEGEKMSKSVGNFVTIRELLATDVFGDTAWHGSVLRLAMLMTHYRQPIDWTVERLVDARRTLKEWIDVAAEAGAAGPAPPTRLLAPLLDDLNTPAAIGVLHGLYRDARADAAAAPQLSAALRFLGLWRGEKSDVIFDYGRKASAAPSEADVRPLLDARAAARARKDFKESDRIRDELAKMGVVVKDGKDASGNPVTSWEVAR